MSVNPENWDVNFSFPDFNLAWFGRERSWCRNWIVTFPWKRIWSVFEILTQITLEDENELAEIREVFPEKINEGILGQWRQTYLEKLLCLLQCLLFFFFHKDQRRKDGNDFEKDTVPDFPKYTSVTLKRLNFQHSILHYIKELNLTALLVLTK